MRLSVRSTMPLNIRFLVPSYILLALALLMVPCSRVNALSVGDMTVSSAVGERFYGVIKLEETRRVSLDQILVTLAPRSVYQRMGVDWEYFHTGLIFDVLQDERDGVYLRVVSKDVLFEPYLDFVISVRWPTGFISKQYTVLLDMPAAISNRAAGPSAASVSPPSDTSGSIQRQQPEAVAQQPDRRPVARDASPVVVSPLQQEGETVASIDDVVTSTAPEVQSADSAEVVAEPVIEAEVVVEESVVDFDREVSVAEAEAEIDAAEGGVSEDAQAEEIAEAVETQPSVADSLPIEEKLIDEVVEEEVVEEALAENISAEAERVEEETQNEVVAKAGEAESALAGLPQQEVASSADAIADTTNVVQESESEAAAVAGDGAGEGAWAVVSQRGDTLWAIARRIQKESGGRVVDIVNALFENNERAFMGNDANRLRVDADLKITLSQIKAATPLAKRAELFNEFRDVVASARPRQSAEPAAQERAATSDKDGVLSLVTQTESAETVSPLTEKLSRDLAENSNEVEEQLKQGNQRAASIETRMENLLSQYQALSDKTAQLKELEEELNRSIAEKAQVEMGLADADLPQANQPPGSEQAPEPQRDMMWWFQILAFVALLALLIYLVFRMLQAKRIQSRNAWVDSKWDNELFADSGGLSDEELAAMVKLKGESVLEDQADIEGRELVLEDNAEGAAELQASLYIAYERYDEAEALLHEALQYQPQNTTLKSQLLEVYAAQGKEEAFEALAAQLIGEGDDQINNKIVSLRREA